MHNSDGYFRTWRKKRRLARNKYEYTRRTKCGIRRGYLVVHGKRPGRPCAERLGWVRIQKTWGGDKVAFGIAGINWTVTRERFITTGPCPNLGPAKMHTGPCYRSRNERGSVSCVTHNVIERRTCKRG